MKKIIIVLVMLFTALYSSAQKKEKTYKVLAACGQCQFDMKGSQGCDLAIQIAGKHYWVKGSNINEHGNEHDEDGMCMTVRKAKAVGRLEGDSIFVSQFNLLKK